MQRVQKILANLLKDSTSSVDVKLSELAETIGRKPILLENIFDAPGLWGTIGDIGAELREHSVKSTTNVTHKCDQVDRKYQRLPHIAANELYQKGN